jgi:hypothetical protein
MATVHVVSKDNHADQHLVEVSVSTLPALAPSSVRVRSTVLGLTANNLSYARMGSVYYWWSAYPVQIDFPAPFNDTSKYGIVPAWGFATVLESKITDIKVESLIFGFWPLSSLPVDLQLEPAKLSGHWWETSEHRQKMMTLYNRYMIDDRKATSLADEQNPQTIELGWEAATRVLWSCGHLLNCFVFPGHSNVKPVHPLVEKLLWSREDADLSSTVLVSLSASTKTGLSVADQVIHNRPREAGPVGLLAVASKPDKTALCLDGAPFPTKAVTYSQGNNIDTKSWIQSLVERERPTRVLIMDFGGRGNSLQKIHDMLTSLELSVTTLAVGSEAKAYTSQELAASRADFERLNKIQSNASGQRSSAMAQIGDERYFAGMFEEWKRFRGRGGFPGMRLKWIDGMIGEKGIEGAWKKLCDGTASVGGENIVLRL